MFELKISTANAAFDDLATELARILRDIAQDLENGQRGSFKIMDINGNTIGHATLSAA